MQFRSNPAALIGFLTAWLFILPGCKIGCPRNCGWDSTVDWGGTCGFELRRLSGDAGFLSEIDYAGISVYDQCGHECWVGSIYEVECWNYSHTECSPYNVTFDVAMEIPVRDTGGSCTTPAVAGLTLGMRADIEGIEDGEVITLPDSRITTVTYIESFTDPCDGSYHGFWRSYPVSGTVTFYDMHRPPVQVDVSLSFENENGSQRFIEGTWSGDAYNAGCTGH